MGEIGGKVVSSTRLLWIGLQHTIMLRVCLTGNKLPCSYTERSFHREEALCLLHSHRGHAGVPAAGQVLTRWRQGFTQPTLLCSSDPSWPF